MNEYEKSVLARKPWWFIMRTNSDTLTVADQQFYQLPFNYRKINTLTITSGTSIYPVQLCPSRAFWDQLNFSASPTSTWPIWFYVIDGQVGLWPTPSTDDLPMNFTYEVTFKDLTIADYTTGLILTATNGSAAIVGDGTAGQAWTNQMNDRWFRITETNSAGDEQWYQIDAVTSGTGLTLKNNYNGNSIAAGSSNYAIAQMTLIPDAYHILPVYNAAYTYFLSVNPKQDRAQAYKDARDTLLAQMESDHGNSGSQANINIGPQFSQNVNLFRSLPYP